MRHFRFAAGLAIVALAVSATPALAHNFISSGGTIKGKGEEQIFKLGPFSIECLTATSKGKTEPGTPETLFAEIRFHKCSTKAKIGTNEIRLKTRFVTPFDIEYHANGYVEIGSEEGEEVEGNATLKGGTVEVRIHSIKCVITLPEQTLPKNGNQGGEFEAATYNPEEEQIGNRTFFTLSIFNEFNKMKFEFGEGQCESFHASEEERKQGRYEGELLERIAGGSLSWE